jgi:hypothetical protein
LRLRQYKFCRSGQAAESKEKTYFSVGFLSGRPDLNWGPHGPELIKRFLLIIRSGIYGGVVALGCRTIVLCNYSLSAF